LVNGIFEHQTVIISGAIGDIGRATVLAFAAHGAAIAMGDIRPAKEAKAFLQQLKRQNVNFHYQQVDVSNPRHVRNWFAVAERKLGSPSLIVPNAATVTVAPPSEIAPEQWSREIRVNLDGAFFLAQAATSRLLQLGLPGRVVFVGSWAGSTPHPNMPAYSVSKAGLRMLCKCMALELAPHGILVNELAPGYVNAGLSRAVRNTTRRRYSRFQQKVPLKKLTTPQEVAEQIVYLCRPENQQMTGSTLCMDGGLSLLS
jgi:NAD(P)-dependent dehydrogenase (short-subunit alcohol dehydrogenase family)